MEAEVIPLPLKKKKEKPADYGPQFYCLRCDGGEFSLHSNGVVTCARCGSLMRNIFVTQMPDAS